METEESKESVSPDMVANGSHKGQQQKPKRKKIMNEKALEQLKLAREKAAEKRRQLGEIKRREKTVKEEMLNKRIKELEVKEKVAKKPVIDPPSESESESEAESEESVQEAPPPKESFARGRDPKRKSKPIDIAKSSPMAKKPRAPKKIETDNLASESARYEMKQRMLQDTYRSAYASLFPNHLYNMF